MKRTHRVCRLSLLLLTWAATGLAAARDRTPADTLLLRGKVYTVNQREPWAQAVAIRGGKIVAVGSNEQIEAYRGPSTRVIDAANHMVLPGFADDHVHFALVPFMSRIFEIDASSIVEVQEAVKKHLAAHRNDSALLGWVLLTGEAVKLTKQDLDAVVSDRPVFIDDGHAAWANSKALQMAGITRNTPDPRGGRIVHDPKTGDTTGMLWETAAAAAFFKVAGEPGNKVRGEAYLQQIHEFNRLGLTRLFSLGFDADHIDVFDELRRDGRLTIKMSIASVATPPKLLPEDIEKFEALRRQYHDTWLNADAVKFFDDGLVETGSAAMLEPYAGTDDRGKTIWSPEELTSAITELNRRGFKVIVHSTGDRSARDALDAFEQAERKNGRNDTVKRIEHVEHISDQDLPRFARLGVLAGMQPTFLREEDWSATLKRLGPDHMHLAYAWAALENAGAHLSISTDTPGYSMSPWDGIQVALTSPYVPEQRLTLPQAIKACSLDAARASGVERTEGSLEVGKSADLIIISQNLFDIDPRLIGKTQVLTTMVEGRVVWSKPSVE